MTGAEALEAQIDHCIALIEQRNHEILRIRRDVDFAFARAVEHARGADCRTQLILSDIVEWLRPHVSQPSLARKLPS